MSSAVLKNWAKELGPPLVTLFSLHLEQSKLSTSWKLANVLSAHGQSDREHVSNYRPVVLLSIVSGVMETCFYNHISIITNNMICSEQQHGFLKDKPCSTQLADVYH